MTTSLQKKREILYAVKAAELLKQPWIVNASPDEINWPDLIVTEKSCSFGLEVREVYLDETSEGSLKKAREVHNQKTIVDLARDYYKRSKVPIRLKLLGRVGAWQTLMNLITDEAARLHVWEQKRFEAGDGCVVYVTRLPEQFQGYSRWPTVSDRVGRVASMSQVLLENVIVKKAEKLRKYKKCISDVRLLIVSDRIYNSGKARLAVPIQCQSFGFSAVYYMSFPEEAWLIAN